MNATSFEYTTSNGVTFKSDRCDFRNVINVTDAKVLSKKALLREVSEMIGYHATNILGKLNGFQGYDTIHYEIRS